MIDKAQLQLILVAYAAIKMADLPFKGGESDSAYFAAGRLLAAAGMAWAWLRYIDSACDQPAEGEES